MGDLHHEIDWQGFSIVPQLLTTEEVDSLLRALAVDGEDDRIRKRNGVYAIRNLLDVVPAIRSLAESPKVTHLIRSVLGDNAIPVRGTLFDKTSDANWLVPWHQDLTICVQKKIDVIGYGPWTTKAGVQHVQPPTQILDGMLALRIHLDDCHERNGALRVLPSTHRLGRLNSKQIDSAACTTPQKICSVAKGGALLMKPLLLHASSAAEEASHRRVIHIDYAVCKLAAGLKWINDTSN